MAKKKIEKENNYKEEKNKGTQWSFITTLEQSFLIQ